jgi:rare lipoprotein A
VTALLLAGQIVLASWYGPGFHGRLTASGETFDQNSATCAHRSLPFNTVLRLTRLANGKTATCRVSDRGPFVAGRALDVSKGVAKRLGFLDAGLARVRIEQLN